MAIVRDLVKRGWQVAVADIIENEEFEKELGDRASFFKCNVADYDRYVSHVVRYLDDYNLTILQSSGGLPRGLGQIWSAGRSLCKCWHCRQKVR